MGCWWSADGDVDEWTASRLAAAADDRLVEHLDDAEGWAGGLATDAVRWATTWGPADPDADGGSVEVTKEERVVIL